VRLTVGGAGGGGAIRRRMTVGGVVARMTRARGEEDYRGSRVEKDEARASKLNNIVKAMLHVLYSILFPQIMRQNIVHEAYIVSVLSFCCRC
jgi:hypothetical protein